MLFLIISILHVNLCIILYALEADTWLPQKFCKKQYNRIILLLYILKLHQFIFIFFIESTVHVTVHTTPCNRILEMSIPIILEKMQQSHMLSDMHRKLLSTDLHKDITKYKISWTLRASSGQLVLGHKICVTHRETDICIHIFQ